LGAKKKKPIVGRGRGKRKKERRPRPGERVVQRRERRKKDYGKLPRDKGVRRGGGGVQLLQTAEWVSSPDHLGMHECRWQWKSEGRSREKGGENTYTMKSSI